MYCLHALKRTKEEEALLLSGPASVEDEPAFHYNLACYEARLGRLDAARERLARAVAMDRSYAAAVKTNPNLKALADEAPLISSPRTEGKKQ